MVVQLKDTYSQRQVIEPFYTGGDASIVDNLLASACDDRVVLTDIKTGKILATLDGDGELVSGIEISPDKTKLVVSSRSLLLHFYELLWTEEEEEKEDSSSSSSSLQVKKIKQVKSHDAPVLVLSIDSTSTLVATGGADSVVKVWDLKGGFVTHNLKGHGGIVSALKFWTKAGEKAWKLASGSDDCKVKVWDLISSKCTATLDNHVSIVRGLDFNEDGTVLVSAGRDKVISVWEQQPQQQSRPSSRGKYTLAHTIPVYESLESVGFVDKTTSTTIYYGGESGYVKTRSLDTSLPSVVSEGGAESERDEQIYKIICDPYRKSLLSILSDQSILELDVPSLTGSRRIVGNHGEVIDCLFADNETRDVLVLATNSAELRVISIQKPLEATILSGHKDIVICIDRTYDGAFLASAGKDNEVRLWRRTGMSSYEPIAVYTGHTASIGAIGTSRVPTKGLPPRFIISGSQDLTVKRWDVKSQMAVYTRKAHDKDINAIDVSPDDQMFATASQDRTIKIWNTDSGEEVGVLKGHRRGVWTVKFSAWDKYVASGSGDKTIKLWNLKDMQCIRTFEGHANSVLKVTFLNQGKQLASAGADGLVKVWDISSGECLTTLDNHEDKVWSLCASGDCDGDLLISGAGDSVITIWKDVSEEKRALESEEAALQIEQEQELQNLVRTENWGSAFALALSLDHPHRLLKLLEQARDCMEPGSITGLAQIDSTIAGLESKPLLKFLGRVRDWNTNARTSAIAQSSLHVILRHHDAGALAKLPGIKSIIDALVPYTDRHYTRVDEFLSDTSVVEYAVDQMLYI